MIGYCTLRVTPDQLHPGDYLPKGQVVMDPGPFRTVRNQKITHVTVPIRFDGRSTTIELPIDEPIAVERPNLTIHGLDEA
jgi:hypothetical protein